MLVVTGVVRLHRRPVGGAVQVLGRCSGLLLRRHGERRVADVAVGRQIGRVGGSVEGFGSGCGRGGGRRVTIAGRCGRRVDHGRLGGVRAER